MRAATRRNGRLVVDDMAAPVPGIGQVLCKSLVCGICGSDLHAIEHCDHKIDKNEAIGGLSAMKKGEDTVFGHEFCCGALEFGRDSERRFKAGTRVVSMPTPLTPAVRKRSDIQAEFPVASRSNWYSAKHFCTKSPMAFRRNMPR